MGAIEVRDSSEEHEEAVPASTPEMPSLATETEASEAPQPATAPLAEEPAHEMAPETPEAAPAAPDTSSYGDDNKAEAAEPAPVAPAATSAVVPADRHAGLSGRSVFEALLVIVIIALALWSWTLYSDRNNLRDQIAQQKADPQALVKQQTDSLLARVGALMQLPSGETPTIADVSDAGKAKQQSAFFANAQNGDKVLMYVKAGEAILYRPSTNKIILVAPLTFTNSSTTSAATTTTPGTTSAKSTTTTKTSR